MWPSGRSLESPVLEECKGNGVSAWRRCNALQQKRPEIISRKCVVFYQGNARPHTSLVIRQKLLQLEWDTMPTPAIFSRPGTIGLLFVPDHSKIFKTLKPTPQMRRSKTTSISFLPEKTKNFTSVELCHYQKDGKRCWTPQKKRNYFPNRPIYYGRRRRRNKSMVTPVHRFQSTENSTFSQQLRRPHQPSESQPSPDIHQEVQYLSNEPVNEPIISRPSPPPALDAPVYIGAPYEAALNPVPHPQIMRLGGLTKYGMWASFGLTTASVAATKFYVDYQGTFEILLLCTMGVLGAGLLVSCALTVCKKNAAHQFINVQVPQPQPTAVEMEIPEMMPQREIIITPMTNISPQTTPEARPAQDLEQPPPPYHIAILLPLKESDCIDFPPPSYENAVR